ncbi:hypothetical protein BZA77DRAFT_359064 [Pyronema omphalodes]|nr:hypothetical protein BZA77DRAFT_359064 [Pyronema omphalodes]
MTSDAEIQSKKRKRTNQGDFVPSGSASPQPDALQHQSVGDAEKKKKKQRSRKPKQTAEDESIPPPVPDLATPVENSEEQSANQKATRFIVFIGNLPYTATKASVAAHFSAVEPSLVRVMTHKEDPAKCKGFGFLEFARYDKMEQCLTKFHHTMFTDGKSAPRKINVELTAGGGGRKSKVRQEKLIIKNAKLNEERQQVASDRAKDKADRRAQAEDGENGMHPSRRRRIQ